MRCTSSIKRDMHSSLRSGGSDANSRAAQTAMWACSNPEGGPETNSERGIPLFSDRSSKVSARGLPVPFR